MPSILNFGMKAANCFKVISKPALISRIFNVKSKRFRLNSLKIIQRKLWLCIWIYTRRFTCVCVICVDIFCVFHSCELSFVDVVLDYFLFYYSHSCDAVQSVLTCLTYIVLTNNKILRIHVWSEQFYSQHSACNRLDSFIHLLIHSQPTHPDLIDGSFFLLISQLFHSVRIKLFLPYASIIFSAFRI